MFDEAERLGDQRRAEALRSEIEFIEDQLAAAVGRWGRDPRAASAAERARLTVTKRIKGVLERIANDIRPLRTILLAPSGRDWSAPTSDPDRTTHWSI